MRVVFVYRGAENLGIEYLSSVLKQKGHQTFLVFDPGLFDDKYNLSLPFLNRFFDYKNRLIKEIVSYEPDLVAFSVITDLYQWACKFAREVKEALDVPIVFGGIHPTSVPEVCLESEFLDYVIVGEGEEALVELVENLERKSGLDGINNLYFKKNGRIIKNTVRCLKQNLDEIPIPDKDLFSSSIITNDAYSIMTGRGCPYSCSFCCNNILKKVYSNKGKYVRRRSPSNVIEELLLMKDKYKFKEVVFCDDVFTLNKDWLADFLDKYRSNINLPFRCLSHSSNFDDEIALMLKKSNCKYVRLSIQTANEKLRRKILKRFETDEQIKSSFKICDNINLRYTSDYILGIPTEREKDYLKAFDIYKNTKNLVQIKCYFLNYFPKTDIVDYARLYSGLNKKDIKSINEGRSKMYYTGSFFLEKNKESYKLAKNFYFLLKMLPVLPKFLSKFIVKIKFYKFFYYMPLFIVNFVDMLITIKERDVLLYSYVKYYFKHINNRLFSKVKSKIKNK